MALGLNDVDVEGVKALDKRIRENPPCLVWVPAD